MSKTKGTTEAGQSILPGVDGLDQRGGARVEHHVTAHLVHHVGKPDARFGVGKGWLCRLSEMADRLCGGRAAIDRYNRAVHQ